MMEMEGRELSVGGGSVIIHGVQVVGVGRLETYDDFFFYFFKCSSTGREVT